MADNNIRGGHYFKRSGIRGLIGPGPIGSASRVLNKGTSIEEALRGQTYVSDVQTVGDFSVNNPPYDTLKSQVDANLQAQYPELRPGIRNFASTIFGLAIHGFWNTIMSTDSQVQIKQYLDALNEYGTNMPLTQQSQEARRKSNSR